MSVIAHPFARTLSADELPLAISSRLISNNPDAHFRVLLREGDTRIRLAQEAGFFCVRKTWCGEVNLQDIRISSLAQARERVLAQAVQLSHVPQERLEDWLALHEQCYRQTHKANPLAVLDRAGRQAVFAGQDFRPEAAFCAMSQDRIIAYASLRQIGQTWEFGWSGALSDGATDPKMLNCALKMMEVQHAQQAGLESLYLERDSTDAQAMELAPLLPIYKPEIWLTYQSHEIFKP